MILSEQLRKSIVGRKKKQVVEELEQRYPCIKYLEQKDVPIDMLVYLEYCIENIVNSYAKSYARIDMKKFQDLGKKAS